MLGAAHLYQGNASIAAKSERKNTYFEIKNILQYDLV